MDSRSYTEWITLEWNEDNMEYGDITYQMRTGPTEIPDGSWGSWSAEFTNPLGSDISSVARNNYMQWKANFTSNNTDYSPILYLGSNGFNTRFTVSGVALTVANSQKIGSEFIESGQATTNTNGYARITLSQAYASEDFRSVVTGAEDGATYAYINNTGRANTRGLDTNVQLLLKGNANDGKAEFTDDSQNAYTIDSFSGLPHTASGVRANMLANGDMNDWPLGASDKTPYAWEDLGAAVVYSRETTTGNTYYGSYALTCVGNQSQKYLTYQGVAASGYRGGRLNMNAWVKTEETTVHMEIINPSGVVVASGIFHDGDDSWQDIGVDYDVAENDDYLYVALCQYDAEQGGDVTLGQVVLLPSGVGPAITNNAAIFDGWNGWITAPQHPGSEDWMNMYKEDDVTIDFWVKHVDYAGSEDYFSFFQDTNNYFKLEHTATGMQFYLYDSTAGTAIDSGIISDTAIKDRYWHHIACILHNGYWSLYIDGVQKWYGENTYTANKPIWIGPLYLGTRGSTNANPFWGSIDDFRIEFSNIFNATPNSGLSDTITVPTDTPDTTLSTRLLLDFDSDINDRSNRNHYTSQNAWGTYSARPSHTTKILNSGAVFFDGAYSVVETPTDSDFEHGTGDWTYECFFMLDNTANHNSIVDNGGPTLGIRVTYDYSSKYMNVEIKGINPTWSFYPQNGVWYHFVLMRVGNTAYGFIDGELIGTQDITGVDITGLALPARWGFRNDNNYPLNGWMTEMRISPSGAYSASGFDVPTQQHEADAGTIQLIHGDGIDCETDLLDSSNQENCVRRFYDVSLDSSQYKFGSYSAHFDGSSDFIRTMKNPNFDIGTDEDVTIEGWFRFETNTTAKYLWDIGRYSSGPNPWTLYWNASALRLLINSSYVSTWTWTPVIDTWYHIAVVRYNGTITCYVNGTALAGAVDVDTAVQTGDYGLALGCYDDGSGSWLGWIDEFRYSKVARYTSNFTEPSSPFTDDADTLCLLHFERHIDASTKDKDIKFKTHNNTVYKGAEINEMSKFGQGCLSFDGDYDVFEIDTRPSQQEAFDIHYGENKTMDFWVRHHALGGTQIYAMQWYGQDGTSDEWLFFHHAGHGLCHEMSQVCQSKSINTGYFPGLITDNDWHHIAYVKKGKDLGWYVDGVQKKYLENYNQKRFRGPLLLGSYMGNEYGLDAWMDDVRFEDTNTFGANPNVGLTDTIEIPTASPTPSGNTLFLVTGEEIFDGNNHFVDSSANQHSITQQYGGQLIKPILDGDTVYWGGMGISTRNAITVTDASGGTAFDFGTGDFCIETFVNFSKIYYHWIWDFGYPGSNGVSLWMTSGSFGLQYKIGSTVYDTHHMLSTGKWYHIAITRTSGKIRLFVDGKKVGDEQTITTDLDFSSDAKYVGNSNSGDYGVKGFMSEFRVSKGTNRGYYENFTPPTARFSDDGNTSLLLHMNGSDWSTTYTDSSSHSHTIGVVNTPYQVKCGKFGNGGLFFDGQTHYNLVRTNNAQFDFGNEDFCWGAWVNNNYMAGGQTIFCQGDNSSYCHRLYLNGASNTDHRRYGLLRFYKTGRYGTIDIQSSAYRLWQGEWHYVEVKKEGNYLQIYIDGIPQRTVQPTYYPHGLEPYKGPFVIGAYQYGNEATRNARSSTWNGWITDANITIGRSRDDVMQGRESYPPSYNTRRPVTEFTADGDCILHVKFDQTAETQDFYDSSALSTELYAEGYAYNRRMQFLTYSEGCLCFDGYSSIHYGNTATGLDFGTGDFTIDCYFMCSASNVAQYIFSNYVGGSPPYGCAFYMNSSGNLYLQLPSAGGARGDSPSIYQNRVYHVAVVKWNNYAKIFLDGVQLGTDIDVTAATTCTGFTNGTAIGSEAPQTSGWVYGWIDNLRVIKGLARWVDDFTPPDYEYYEGGTFDHWFDVIGAASKIYNWITRGA